ncbi:MAG: GH1 family beta-glucosidase [Oscillospiraceae bacterium]|nr:GH1 family beta-glucosidase [Oscillospiraceae bacterium]
MGFSENFIWGVASSAYQTEGAAFEDGKGASIWDSFSRKPGAVFEGDTGDIACDGYHRYQEDIELMASMGIKAYRFSISWPRVDPQGDGTFNELGFAYYDRVIDSCLSCGIEPYITLYHWDLPQLLEDRGGWQNRNTCLAFAGYCRAVAERFRGRVRHYFTINEIQCVVSLGYQSGIYAPGKMLPVTELFQIWHNLLMAHGLAYREIKDIDPSAHVSLASTGKLCCPETGKQADLEAARKASFEISADDWLFTHNMALDPVIFGEYPETDDPVFRPLFGAVPRNELGIINTGADTLALNIYNGSSVRAGKNGEPEYVPKAPGCPRTALKWPVTPEVMEYGPRFICERYHRPVLITENGVSCNDLIYLDGKVHDLDRIDFLTRYLGSLRRCIESGVPVNGYFHWSFTDNFEWSRGYSERMGLVYVDYLTHRRIPKESAAWFSLLLAKNGENLDNTMPDCVTVS